MQLSIYINGKYERCWPVDLPEKKRTLTPEENFNIREKALNDTLSMAKMDVADLLETGHWEFFFEAKARIQPKDVILVPRVWFRPEDIKPKKLFYRLEPLPLEAPLPKVVRLPGEYSNVKSLYK